MSMVGKPGYRETTIGWIPDSWPIRRLEEISTDNITYGVVQPGPEDENGVRLVRGGDVKSGRVSTTLRTISNAVSKQFSRTVLRGGELLVSLVGYPGETAIAGEELAGTNIARQVGLVRLCVSNDAYFVQQYLSSPIGKKVLLGGMIGSAQQVINLSALREVEVPLPPFQEQQKIAAILTAVDDKLDVIARQIETTQTLKKGLMQTLFSQGVGVQDADGPWMPHTEFKDSELGEIPAGWKVAPLGELIEKLMDFRGRTPKKLGMDWGGGVIPALSANNVRMGYIDFNRECYLGSDELYAAWMVQGDTRKNDLVFTMEAPLGNVAVIPDDRKYILSQRVVLLRANQRVKHSYLFQYLRSETFRKILEANSTGTTAKGIQQKRLVQLPVVVPSQDEQERIADMLGAIDGKLDALLLKQSHYQTFKRGLMQKLLTGEWRVSVDANTTGT